jgi:TRAP-type C4-dicarboxylate transport system permease small subunit
VFLDTQHDSGISLCDDTYSADPEGSVPFPMRGTSPLVLHRFFLKGGSPVFSWLKFTAKKAPLIISSISLVIMMLVVVVHVIGRNFFSSPLYGGVEIISLSGVILISFALGYTQLQKAHIAVEVLVSRLSNSLRMPIAIFVMVVNLVTVSLLIWGGIDYFWDAIIKRGSYTLVLHLPSAPFRFVWVLGCVALWGYFLHDLIELLRKGKTV